MKHLIFTLCSFLFFSALHSQVTTDTTSNGQLSVITKNDGTQYIGVILSDDGREVLIETEDLGKIYIPKSDIRSIEKVTDQKNIVNGEYRTEGPFTTRYAFTSNALPIRKGENYAMLSIYGPEVHFAVTDNFSLGIMTTWIASPFAAVLKYTFKTQESNVNYALGTIIGTSGWINNLKGYIGLHWVSMTLGDRLNNFTVSAGYSYFNSGAEIDHYEPGVYENTYPTWTTEGAPTSKGPMASVSGIFKVGAKASVFIDVMGSFSKRTETVSTYEFTGEPYTDEWGYYYPTGGFINTVTEEEISSTTIFFMPGMRFQNNDKNAWQVYFIGVTNFSQGVVSSFPIPMFSRFYKF